MSQPEALRKEKMKGIESWLEELRSLGLPVKRKNDLNDNKELQDLTDNIKLTLYQEYKTAYSEA